MKIPQPKRRRREQGYLLLVTVSSALILGLTVGGYLLVINQEDKTVVRSQCWNSALAVAEAGVDEALAQMNASVYSFSANGWGSSGLNIYGPVTRSLATGSGSYIVTISNDASGTLPTIYSTGTVPVPYSGPAVSRAVVVTAVKEYFFNIGLGAVSNITLKGNSLATDSWNSHTNTLSTNGQYSASMTSTNGDVASEGGLVSVGNQTIKGNLYLGPTATYTSQPNGGVTGTIYYDNNIQFPNVTLPTTDTNGNSISWLPATTVNNTNIFGTGSGTNFSYLSGYYYVSNSKPIYVAPGQTVTLQVETTTFDFSSMTIDGGTANAGTLIVYQDSGTVTMSKSSGGALNNRPENFMYFGLSNVTSIATLNGNGIFIGAIYAPQASVTLGGGGQTFNFEGSVVVNDLTMNGHFDLHYDESLATAGPPKGYIATSWQEIIPY